MAVPARDQDPDRHDASGGEGSPPEADSPRACPYCGERQLRWVGQLPATYGWYQRVSLIPRAVKKRWQREREAARAQLHADSTLEAQKVPP